MERLAALPADTALQAALEQAERTFGERVDARDALRHQFESTGGERLGEDVDRAAKAETQLRRKLQDARGERIRLETTLSAAGEDGRHEQVQELEAEREQARSVLDRVLREATAARRLFEVLEHEYQSARERLTRPVIARIRPYLSTRAGRRPLAWKRPSGSFLVCRRSNLGHRENGTRWRSR